MELTFEQQSFAFLWSIPLGAALGALYGVLALIRFAFNSKKSTVIPLDIIFMLLCSLCVFYFSLGFLDGYVRIYVILGVLIGFFIYRLTLGRLLHKIFKPIVKLTRGIIVAIFTKIELIAKKLLKISFKVLYNIWVRIESFNSSRKLKKSRRNKYGKKSNGKKAAGAQRRA